MLSTTVVLAMSLTLQLPSAAYPGGYQVFPPNSVYPSPPPMVTDYAGGSFGRSGLPAEATVGYGEQLYPYDYQAPWHHGYVQEIPAYGGFSAFLPYNYKHVLSQSQTAGGWGMSPTMPYSHQFWHRYHQRASLSHQAQFVGASEYAAELARLRARHDFNEQNKIAADNRVIQRPFAPPVEVGTPQVQPRADNLATNRSGQYGPLMHSMNDQIEQQNAQLRAMKQALEQKQQSRQANSFIGPHFTNRFRR